MKISDMFEIVPSEQCPSDKVYLVSKVQDEEKPWETRQSVSALHLNAESGHRLGGGE
jgi:hypothetical protein